jgi:hypothetical protein
MPAIGHALSEAFHLPARMDNYVFTRILLRKAGYELAESQLTEECVLLVRDLAYLLDRRAGYEPIGRVYSEYEHEFDTTPRISITETAMAAAMEVLPSTKEHALKVLVGMKPELRLKKGALSQLRPVARAALRRELLVLAGSILRDFEKRGRLRDTDFLIEADGSRRPA